MEDKSPQGTYKTFHTMGSCRKSASKQLQTVFSAGKVMATVFRDYQGRDYHEKGESIALLTT